MDSEKLNTEKFYTEEDAGHAAGGYAIRPARAEAGAPGRVQKLRISSFQKTADRFWKNKLLRNTAICAVAALVIWGIASSGTPAGQQAAGTIRSVIDYQSNLEKDLGDLKFVDSALEEDAAMVLSEDASTAPAGNCFRRCRPGGCICSGKYGCR